MRELGRRTFLKTAGISSLLVATGERLSPSGFGGHLDEYSRLAQHELDPTNPSDFAHPLLLPLDRGQLGIFGASSTFTMTAKEIDHEILPGRVTKLWAYEIEQAGKRYINPILKVRRGDGFNTTLRNELPDGTVIHWHGFRVDGRNDAHPSYVIPPGGEDHYAFEVLNRAAAYWYHPHPSDITGRQVYLGLASFFLVDDDQDEYLKNALDLNLGETDIPLLLQDRRFDSDGALTYNPTMTERFMGFLGDVILVNHTVKPYLDVSTRTYRFRVLNGSNARIYRLAFMAGSNRMPFALVGNDGGLLEKPYQSDEVFLAPGERVDVLLDLSNLEVGDVVFLKSLAFDPMENEMRGMGRTMDGMGGSMTDMGDMGRAMGDGQGSGLENGEEFYILTLKVQKHLAYDRPIPARLSEITAVDLKSANRRRFLLSNRMMQWFINGWTFQMNEYPVVVARGSVEIWEIQNSPMSMPHPMHIHGFPFQVLKRTGSPRQTARLAVDNKGLLATDQGWKDTLLVWPGEKVWLAVDFSHAFLGEQSYLFHCHNLEHEDQGMMINYKVI